MTADAVRSPSPPGLGTPVTAALLVCTHGRREVCCAKFGRPVAAALAAECLLRREFGLTGISAIRHVGGRGLVARFAIDPPGTLPVSQAVPTFEVELTRRPAGCPRPTSCGEGTVEQPSAFRLQSVAAVPAVPTVPTTAPAPPQTSTTRC
jgi:hypothetical protein